MFSDIEEALQVKIFIFTLLLVILCWTVYLYGASRVAFPNWFLPILLFILLGVFYFLRFKILPIDQKAIWKSKPRYWNNFLSKCVGINVLILAWVVAPLLRLAGVG